MCIISSTIAAGIMTALKVVGTVMSIASTAISVPAAIQQGKNAQAMYNYQAKVAKKNAEIAQQNADQERQAGLEEARWQRIKTLQSIGSQQVAMAGNGIDITSGTALDTIEDTAQMGELDALMIQYNSERAAQNYEQQASNFNNQANLDVIAGKNAATAGTINGVAYGLNGLSKGLGSLTEVANKWKPSGSITGKTPSISKTPKTSNGYSGMLPQLSF